MRCRTGDLVSVEGEIWYVKLPEDLAAERAKDVAAGRFMDDGGEPILYSPYAAVKVPAGTLIHCTSSRPDWKYWYKKPTNLRQGVDVNTWKTYLFRVEDIVVNVTSSEQWGRLGD